MSKHILSVVREVLYIIEKDLDTGHIGKKEASKRISLLRAALYSVDEGKPNPASRNFRQAAGIPLEWGSTQMKRRAPSLFLSMLLALCPQSAAQLGIADPDE